MSSFLRRAAAHEPLLGEIVSLLGAAQAPADRDRRGERSIRADGQDQVLLQALARGRSESAQRRPGT